MTYTHHDDQSPALSIVIVNSDSASYTLDCLDSIARNPPDLSYEIILVDNRSREPCLPLVVARYPHVRTFVAPQRQGFARNHNLGIQHARGAYILLLNNDTLVCPGALQRLLDAAHAHPEYAILGPQLRWPNGRVQHFCAYRLPSLGSYILNHLVTDPGLPVGRVWTRLLEWRVARRRSGSVEGVSGACMLISRRALAELGPLDEGYAFYYEDVEWCRRAWQTGWAVGYVAEAQVVHIGGRSSAQVRVWAKQQEYHSALRYFGQRRPRQQGIIWAAATVGFFFRSLGYVLAEALTGKTSHARATVYVWHWLLQQRSQLGEPSANRGRTR